MQQRDTAMRYTGFSEPMSSCQLRYESDDLIVVDIEQCKYCKNVTKGLRHRRPTKKKSKSGKRDVKSSSPTAH